MSKKFIRWVSQLVLVYSAALYSLPTNPTVIAGNVTFSQMGSTLTVTSTDDRSIVDWDDFSIDSSETVIFNLPAPDSAILNRAILTNSSISGSIQSSSTAYLINTQGIFFDTSAFVETGSFLASTLDGDNNEFIINTDIDFTGAADAGVFLQNSGILIADNADVILLGYQVLQFGSISTASGMTAISSGTEMVLQLFQEQRVYILPQTYVNTVPLGADIEGSISALFTQISVDGAAYDTGIQHIGTIDALGLPGIDCTVSLTANNGTTFSRGVITTVTDDGRGGFVAIMGDQIQLATGCSIFATGPSGGGTVYIGGGWEGRDPNYVNATSVDVQGRTIIDIDGGVDGEGGLGVVWADHTTSFSGTFTAQGGTNSGDGGMVEISGVQQLNYNGAVFVNAFNGRNGIFLMDPEELHYLPRQESGRVHAKPYVLLSEKTVAAK